MLPLVEKGLVKDLAREWILQPDVNFYCIKAGTYNKIRLELDLSASLKKI